MGNDMKLSPAEIALLDKLRGAYRQQVTVVAGREHKKPFGQRERAAALKLREKGLVEFVSTQSNPMHPRTKPSFVSGHCSEIVIRLTKA